MCCGRWFWLYAVVVACLAACSYSKSEQWLTYTIERVAYEDVLVMEGTTESVNSMNVHCPRHVGGTIISIVESGTEVKKGDVVCVLEDANVAESHERWTLELESAYAELEKLQASQRLDSALLDAQVRTNEAEAILSDADSIQMLYMGPLERRTKELQIERADIERHRLLKKVKFTEMMQKIDVMRIEKHIAWVKRCLKAESDKMESLILRSPKDGIAVRARRWPWSDETWNVGDNVWDGRIVVALPDFEQMKVMIYASETDYKRLQMGDSVMYTFDAMPGNRAWGRITKMASVGKERTEGSQVKTFEIEASIDSLLAPVELGLSTRCHIYVDYVPDTIVVPTISIFDKDSMKVVYVLQGSKYEEREVTLGTASPEKTVIVDGLGEGERIALIKPNEKTLLHDKL